MSKRVITISGPGKKKLDRMLRRLKASDIQSALKEVFAVQGPRAAGHVIKTQLSGVKGGKFRTDGKEYKGRRTGTLARSIMGRGTMYDGMPAMEVGLLRVRESKVSQYGWTQEFGTSHYNPTSPVADIIPKRAFAMTVPIGRNLTPAGVTRRLIDEFGPDELQVIMFRSPKGKFGHVVGKLLLKTEYLAELAQAKSENRQPDLRTIEPMFLLMTKIRVKPGWYLNDGLRDFLPQLTVELLRTLDRKIGGL